MLNIRDRGELVSRWSRCCAGMLLEGVPGSGKTSIIKALLSSPAFHRREDLGLFVVSEELTQRVLEPVYNQGQLTAAAALSHLGGLISPLEEHNRQLLARGWSGRPQHHFTYILERFHLTYAAYYDFLEWNAVSDLDQRLAALGCSLFLITFDAGEMEDRIISSRDNPGWRRYIARYGSSASEIVGHYARRQERLLELAARSHLPHTIIDTTDRDWNSAASTLLAAWKEAQQ